MYPAEAHKHLASEQMFQGLAEVGARTTSRAGSAHSQHRDKQPLAKNGPSSGLLTDLLASLSLS
jgi:hypothetical protein